MATKKQQASSRRNGKHSMGPKTPAGKAASSMNALKHGLRAQKIVILLGEDKGEFDKLHAGLQNQYQPQTPTEQDFVDQAAFAQWQLVRAETIAGKNYEATPNPLEHIAILNRISQIQARFERSYFKAYKELERIKSDRIKSGCVPGAGPAPAEPPAESAPAAPPPPKPPAHAATPAQKSREYYRRQYPNLKVRWYVPESGIDEIWLDNTIPEPAKDQPEKDGQPEQKVSEPKEKK